MTESVPLIKPKEYKTTDEDGVEKTFILSKFDAVEGREIVTQYLASGIPKVGDYTTNKEMMFKLMNYVGVPTNGQVIRLSTEALINNHCGDWEILTAVEFAMMEHNCRFFRDGRLQGLLDHWAGILSKKLSQTLMDSSGLS